MSQTVTTQVAAAPVKKERKPTLSDKYSKFLVSNFNLIKILETKELISAEAVEAAYSEIKLLAPIEEQVEYYEAFLASAKGSKGNPGIKSQMKKFVTQRNKPPKAPRVKKERKSKTETPDAASTNETNTKKERKPRAKKETKVSDDTQNDVVAELVEAANSSMSPVNVAENNSTPLEADPIEAAAKKTRKPRTKKEEGAETKPKKAKAKKEKVVEAPVQEDEEEISTNEFMVGDTKYLIDSENNLYDINTHEEVGTYDASTSSLLPISA